MKKVFFRMLVIVALSAPGSIAYSQVPGGSGDPGLPGDGDDIDGPDVPLDGGVVLLLAAGAAYGYAKFKDQKQESSE